MTLSIDEFKAAAHDFLNAHASLRVRASAQTWGEGTDDVSLQYGDRYRNPEEEREHVAVARAWQALRYDHGFGWISGPVEYGGAGFPIEYARAFDRLEAGYNVPSRLYFGVGHGLMTTAILTAGSEEVKQHYLRALFRADLIGCQLFSEPGAGSDLASVSTSAVRRGEDWVVSGQKVWTSGAQYSDVGLLLARTAYEGPRHAGLTMFLIDMATPGITVRPLRQMTGGSHFNEVFLDEAAVPDRLRLGEVGAGWRVTGATLAKERASVAPGDSNATLVAPFDRIVELARHRQSAGDPEVRQQLARIFAESQVLELTAARFVARGAASGPGPELSACKLAATDTLRRASDVVTDLVGMAMSADTGTWGTFAWGDLVGATPGMRFGGGTDEIQRNIIAERVLGLPR